VTACYIILAVLAAPVLIQQGVTPIGAHLFVFYFGIVSGLTPPVALTAYVAAGIANTPIFRTGFYSFVVAFITFLIPYVLVYDPSLMFEGPLYQTAITFTICAISVVSLTAGVMGYLLRPCTWVERAVLIIAATGIIVPELYSTLAGLAMFAAILGIQLVQRRSSRESKPVVS